LNVHNTLPRASLVFVLQQQCPSMQTDNVSVSSFFGNARDKQRFGLEKRAFTGLTTVTPMPLLSMYSLDYHKVYKERGTAFHVFTLELSKAEPMRFSKARRHLVVAGLLVPSTLGTTCRVAQQS
jgi:hypothetical protein